MRRRHSFIGFILIGFIVVAILLAHILSFNIIRDSNLDLVYLFPLGIVGLGLAFFHIHKITQSRRPAIVISDEDIVTRDGLHWHPEIAVYVKGVKQDIPQMGITNMDMSKLHAMHKRMQARHMHDGPNEQGIIHLKFEGVVRKSDITLARFFEKWGKNIHTLGTTLRMTVNDKENIEYENYVMQDKDTIELRYE